MNIIVVRRNHGKAKTLPLGGTRLSACLALFVVLLVAVFIAGYQLAVNADSVQQRRILVNSWQQQLDVKSQQLEEIKQQSTEQLKSLGIRLAELHAKLIRLDALGEQLILTADIDAEEFDFSAPPALGGPGVDEYAESYRPPSFVEAIEELAQGIEQRESKLQILNTVLGDQGINNERYLAGRPINKGWLSSHYGRRTDPFTGKVAWHSGIDFAGKQGSPVIAVAAGVVTWSGDRNGYGKLVEINHGASLASRYAHADKLLVQVGDLVEKGQAVALMGSSGRSTGPHVHFEVLRDGKAVNPMQYVNRKNK